jgi:purine catabolism regulatory family protein/PucR-like helix-turn-helix protein/diguanylate cyclase with GGDEF domain
MLTVRDLIADLDVRVHAGETSLDLPVRWVHMSELLDPTPWLSGGEVLLTTGMQCDTPEHQREFITRLVDRQLAGLGFGTGFSFDEVPEALLEIARERDFPVFEVPYELPFIAITEAAFTQLVNEQYAVLRRALSAQERLERMVLSERGLEALAGALATLIGAAVLVFDARGELLVHHEFRRPVGAEALATLQTDVRERARRGDAHQFMPGVEDPSRSLALPVAADGAPNVGRNGASATEHTPEAWLVAIKDSEPLSDFDRLTLRQAVTIVALELLRSRVAGNTERRLAGDVLAAIMSGELSGGDLARRLEPFGLGERVAAFVTAHGEGGRTAHAALETALANGLRAEAAAGLVASGGSLVCALVPGLADDELFALGERVAARVGSETGNGVTIGVGRAVDSGEARRSYHEARCTLEAVALGVVDRPKNGNGDSAHSGLRATMSGPRVATYRDLGSFQLLLSLQDDEALKLFCDSILGPIEASEGHYGGELMRSLEAFIEENGQWERAAKRLYCHRHTLRYRIRRVEELTGRDLGNARDRIEFWLALRGRELVA